MNDARLRGLIRNDSWVRPFLTRYKKPLAAAIALSVLTFAFASALMFTSGYLISGAATMPASILLMHLPLIAVRVFGLGKPVLQYLERLTAHDWILRVTSALRLKLFRTLADEAGMAHAARRTGDVLGILSEDIGHLQNLYLRTVLPLIAGWVLWIFATALLGIFSPLAALAMFLLMGVVALLVPLAGALAGAARRMKAKELTAELYAELADNVLGVADWAFSGRSEEYLVRHERLQARRDAIRRAEGRAARRRDFLMQAVFGAAAIVLVAFSASHFGGAPAADESSAANFIAAFVLCFFPLIEAFAPLPAAALDGVSHADSVRRLNDISEHSASPARAAGRKAVSKASDSRDARAAGETASVGAGTPGDTRRAGGCASGEGASDACAPTTSPASAVPASPLDIRIQDVAFSYPGARRAVIDGLDLAIPFGQKVAVLGRSGAGKSTLAALIRGDIAPASGRVTIGGADASALGDAMCRYVGVIQQSPYLFNDTLLANVRVGNPDASEQEVRRVLYQVGLGDTVAHLPQGLSTMMGEAGKRFSGGQRHRIALARVLLQDAPIVILDEPTVGLDPATEREVLATLMAALDGRTVVMVTHHLQGVVDMDRAVFLEDGRIALDGAPFRLARESERYRALLAFDEGFLSSTSRKAASMPL